MSEPIRVVLTPVGPGFVTALEAVAGVAQVVTPELGDVRLALDQAEVLVSFRWDDEWIVPGLRWIQSVSAGTDQFPIEALSAAGIVLTSAVGIHDVQVSEHAFGLLLALTRGIAPSIRNQTEPRWEWSPIIDLAGMTMGVLGLGVIGEAVARRAKAFGMRVIGTKRSIAGYGGAAEQVFRPEQTLEVFRQADVVIITLPDAPDTRDLVGPDELQALRGGFLINVGRGAVVNEPALIDALASGTLRGAGLDVFAVEPLPPDSPLWGMPSVIVSPHMAGASPRYGERLAELFARNLIAYRGEGPWVNRIV